MVKGPILEILSKRKTFILDEPLVVTLGLDPVAIDRKVPIEEAIAITEKSKWAVGLAKGICERLAGLTPGTAEYERCVSNVSRRAAEGLWR